VIALTGYQMLYVYRSRLWLPPAAVHAAFLVGYYVLVSARHPASYGGAALGYLALAVVFTWSVCLSQDRSSWQVLVVSAGTVQRAEVSRFVGALAVLMPPAVLSVLFASGRYAFDSDHLGTLVAAFLLHAVCAVLGALAALILLRPLGVRLTVAMLVVLIVVLTAVLLGSA
jgi:hypothetical protein